MTSPDVPIFMTPEQASEKLQMGLRPSTLITYARQGLMPHHKVGRSIRFTDDDLVAFVAATAVPATGSGRSKGSRKRKAA